MVRLMVGRDIQTDRERRHGTPTARSIRSAARYFIVDGLRTRRYPQHAVSFAVSRGEILGIAGLVGAGRSEVARAIFGIEPAVAGTVVLDGVALTLADPATAIRRGVFLVPEDRRSAGLVVDFSIRENVSLPALGRYSTCGLVSRSEERERVSAVCRQLQVKAPSIEVEVATFSGGNQQKVVLAKWLALAPKVLIVDEPTRGIDVGAQSRNLPAAAGAGGRGRGDRDDQQRHGGDSPSERPRRRHARGPRHGRARTRGLLGAAHHGARRGAGRGAGRASRPLDAAVEQRSRALRPS